MLSVGNYVEFLDSYQIPLGKSYYYPLNKGEIGLIVAVEEEYYQIALFYKDATVAVPKSAKLQQVEPKMKWEKIG